MFDKIQLVGHFWATGCYLKNGSKKIKHTTVFVSKKAIELGQVFEKFD